MSKFAWVTLTTNDTYSLGALVLAHSLKRASTAHQLAVLITPGVSDSMRNRLKEVYNVVQEVNVLDSQDAANLALLARPELGVTFTKLHCWKLVQFEKCVFLDADILVLKNCDELFEREELSAAPDISWPDCFNSGVFVFRPNIDTFTKVIDFALKHGSFDGGDQGLLNQYFSDWAQKDISKHLPFIYNTHAFASYSYLPAFKKFRDQIKILHFAGRFKPWLANFDSQTKTSYAPQEFQHVADLIQFWWNIYCDSIHHSLNDQMAGLAGALSRLRLGEARTPEQEAYEQHMRRQCWESGSIDYCGRDSFDNIWKKITQTLESGTPKQQPEIQTEEKQSARLFSADIEDGKVEYDADTNSTITYKKIPKGYQQIITIPQPNGTMKTQTKTFYDPVPVPADEIEEHQKKTTKTSQMDSRKVTDKSVALSNPNTTMIVRKIPNGREEVYTTVNADGTKSIQIKTFYDAEEVEISESTEIEQEVPGDRRIINKQKVPKQQSIQETTQSIEKKTKKTQEQVQQQLVQKQQQDIQQKSVKKFEQETHEEVKFKSETTVEQTRRVSQSTEFSGKSVSKKSNVEEQNIHAITDKKEKKKKTKQPPPPPIEDKPGQKTTVMQKKIPGGTEYHYTTVMEDGRTVTSVKTIYEQEEVEMTDEEIKKYKKQLKEAEKHKDVTESKKLPSKKGTKEVIPSDNPGEVTTVETVRIDGGTEYRYTTVTADGVVKKSSKTVYDPVPVEGEEDEQEVIEEYEEEVIEPGETITETYTSTKSLSVKEHQEEIVHKKKGRKLKN